MSLKSILYFVCQFVNNSDHVNLNFLNFILFVQNATDDMGNDVAMYAVIVMATAHVTMLPANAWMGVQQGGIMNAVRKVGKRWVRLVVRF